MKYIVYLATLLLFSTAVAQNPTILQGNYISNVFGQSNFVKNPNAQTSVTNVTLTTATATRSTTTPLVATTEWNVTITSANGTVAWDTRSFDEGMKNQNCEARFTYRGFQATSKAQIKHGTNVVAELVLTPSATDPRIASINFPCGDLSQPTTFVITDTAILSGIHEIGGIYVGLATNMANVAQAEFVGRLNFGANCDFARTANTYDTPTDSSCTTTSIGGVSAVSGVKSAVTISNAKPGFYRIVFNASVYSPSSTNYCRIRVTDGTTSQVLQIFGSGASNVWMPAALEMQFNYTSQASRTIEYQLLSGDNTSRCSFENGSATESAISVYRFPSSSELVVTPETQNVWGSASWPVGNTGSIYAFSTTSTSAQNITNSGFSSSLASYYGSASASASANTYGMKINNIPPGVYKISAQVSVSQNPAGYDCQVELHDNGVRIASINSGLGMKSDIVAIYRVTSFQSSREFLLKLRSDNASTTCIANVGNGGNFNPSIVFEPLDNNANSALYVQGPVKAAGTGTAIPAGYVGEVIEQTSQSVSTNTATANVEVYVTNAEITLSPGVWDLQYAVDTSVYRGGGVTSSLWCRARITDSAGNGEAGTETFYGNYTNSAGPQEWYSSVHKAKRVNLTSSKTFKIGITASLSVALGYCGAVHGSPTGGISGNDAYTYIRAVRIN